MPSTSNSSAKLVLRPFQQEGCKFLHDVGGRGLLADDMGLGKAQPLYSRIKTPGGWKQMGDIKIGDRVCTPDGKTAPVIGVSPQGLRPTYRVTFRDERFTDCDENHLWKVYRNDYWAWKYKKRRPYRAEDPWRLFSLKDILNHKNKAKLFVPLIDEVYGEKKDLPIDPYVLGLLLGDGTLTIHSVSFSNIDFEILENLKFKLTGGYELRKLKGDNCDYRILHEGVRTPRKNHYVQVLKELNLFGKCSHEKFIPEIYKECSAEQRLELLRGLMSTDGCVDSDKCKGVTKYLGRKKKRETYLSTSSHRLALDFQYLIRSLGGLCTISIRRSFYTYKGVKKEGRTAFVCRFRHATAEIFYALSRKAERAKRARPITLRLEIKSIKYLGMKETQCIMIDHPDHLYITDNFVVTHNTAQSLTYLKEHPELRPALVVCPAGLKLNWQEEAKTWFGEGDVRIIDRFNPTLGPCLNICSYAGAVKYREEWLDKATVPVQVLIADEVHSVKDASTKRTKALKALATATPHVLGLTGTPIVNRPGEVFPILNLIRPDLFPSWPLFMKTYGITKLGKWRKKGKNCGNPRLLRADLQSFTLRRLKKDVLPELPDKARYVVPLQLDNLLEYQEATMNIVRWIKENEGPEKAARAARASAIVKIEKLKQIALRGKLQAAVSWIENFLASGQKLVVFATHNDVISYLKMHFGDSAVTLTGKHQVRQRHLAVQRFQTDPTCILFIANLRAGGVGHSLTAAADTAFIELGWTPGDHDQAEDRPNRIGQTATKLAAWYLIAANTLEKWIAEVIDTKRAEIKQIMDGKEVDDSELLVQILEKILRESAKAA